MTYERLSEFINNEMKMSHIYQPVMIMALLNHGGECSQDQLATALLQYDICQFEYHKKVTNSMVGRELRRHGVVYKDKKIYGLLGYTSLTPDEKDLLIGQCEKKLKEYIEKRNDTLRSHSMQSSGNISGSLKYEILKKAKFRCELCGVSADVRALEIDHIVPRKKYGTDDIYNLQALCYSCNALKKDKDAADFREFRYLYSYKVENCFFCSINESLIELENKLVFLVKDEYPVTNLHRLVVPKRHVVSYFDMSRPEINAAHDLLEEGKKLIKAQDHDVEGFNIGINEGEIAGQTISHCHIHLIPRRSGDVDNPRGGIRNIIPGKGDYSSIGHMD